MRQKPVSQSVQTQPRSVRHHGSAPHQLDVLASAVVSLTTVIAQQQLGNNRRYSLMTYEEAALVTTLSTKKLEEMIHSGRLKEGRHYVKEGSRVLFHYNLVDLLFEDKIDREETVTEEPHKTPPAKLVKSKASKPGYKCGINLKYRGGN